MKYGRQALATHTNSLELFRSFFHLIIRKGIAVGQKRIAGVVWYRLEDYEAARLIMEDRAALPATYSSWRIKAEQTEKQMRRLGWATVSAYINAPDFVTWCGARGLNIDAEARNEFANGVAIDAARGMN